MKPHSLTSLSLLACAAALACMSATQSASAQTVLDYAGKWTFDDCSATNVLRDTSGNNATAVRGSSVACVPDAEGRPNGAVALLVSQPGDGTSATTVSVSNTSAFRFGENMSVSARIMPGATPGGAILTKGWTNAAGVAQKTFQLAIVRSSTGVPRLKFTMWLSQPGSNTSTALSIQSQAVIPPSVWTQVGASYDLQNGMQLFINGQVVASSPQLDGVIADAPVGISSKLWLGGGAPQQTFGYTGAIDDVWVSKGSCADLQSSVTAVRDRELMITNPLVVDDAVRTTGKGAWTFARLMEQMVPTDASDPTVALNAAADMVETMFKSFGADQVINKQTIKKRDQFGFPNVNALVLDTWPRLANGKLDLAQSPLRLLAIVNRMDLRSLSRGDAGEGRFIFGVLNPNGTPSQFTIILEYRLPAKTAADIRIWARNWHALGTQAVGSPAYNTALQAITDRFTTRGAYPTRINGSAIGQVRTNERAMSGVWEMRQFELGLNAGVSTLIPSPVALTPGELFKTMPGIIGPFINENAAAIVAGTYTVPLSPKVSGVQLSFFQGGSALVGNEVWNGDNILPFTSPTTSLTTSASDMRHTFALNTCNGCHFISETGTTFLHVSPRAAGAESVLSGFLKGTTTGVPDPINASTPLRNFNDLKRRQEDMNTKLLACPAPTGTTTTLSAARTTSTSTTTTPQTSLTQGISRVH